MNKLFKTVLIKFYLNRLFLRSSVLIALFALVQSQSASACRYNVREVGFVDLQIEPYYLFGYVNDETNEDVVSKFEQVAHTSLENSNIVFEIINVNQQKDHPAMKLLDLQQVKVLPTTILVSPDGQSHPVHLDKPNKSLEEVLLPAIEDILSSPKRDEILQEAIKNYAVVLLIQGTDNQENQRAKEAASNVIELISSQMDMMPKPIANPPVLVEMGLESLQREQILLWSLALDGEEVNEPHAAVIYGRGRWIGPMFRGKEISEDNLANVLFVIGQDCECGLDHRWLQGTMLPARWNDEMQEQVAENLGFDPESPMIKMEMSWIVRKGSYSYPGTPFGYQEMVVEPDSNTEADHNSVREVEDIVIPKSNQVKSDSATNPLAEGNSPLQNTILLLIGLCILVLTSGIVILIRAKNR